MGRNRRLAARAKTRGKRSLGFDAEGGGSVAKCAQQAGDFFVAFATFDADRSLAHCRQALLDRQVFANTLGETQPFQSRRGQNSRIAKTSVNP